MQRELFINPIYKINKEIGANGMVTLLVNNVSGYLKASLIIECSKEEESKLQEIIIGHNFIKRTDRGVEEIIEDMSNRQGNTIGISPGCQY